MLKSCVKKLTRYEKTHDAPNVVGKTLKGKSCQRANLFAGTLGQTLTLAGTRRARGGNGPAVTRRALGEGTSGTIMLRGED